MKYSLVGNGNTFQLIKSVFENRGIVDYQKFVDLPSSVEQSFHKLKNIDKATDLAAYHINKNSKFFIQIDEDFDGYSSAAILYNYLSHFTDNIGWRTHDGKKHGIIPNTIPSDTDLLIIPDSSSNEHELHKEVVQKGTDILILDHHQIHSESPYAITINNQIKDQEYDNKDLSAAGIVYKFCQSLDEYYSVSHADNYLDLVACGNIADSMSTKPLETRYYIQQGLKNINNPLLKTFVKNHRYIDGDWLKIKDVSWSIAPMINAIARVGSVQEREMVFYALTNQVEEENLDRVYEIMGKIRERQNEIRGENNRMIDNIVNGQKLYEDNIIIVDASEFIQPALSGLTAIHLASKHKRPTLVLRGTDNGNLRGSARNADGHPITNLRQFLSDSGLFVFCEGHPQAFGLEIKRENVSKVVELFEKTLELGEDQGYKVDFKLDSAQLSYPIIATIDEYKHVWGKDVEEPQFAIKDVLIDVNSAKVIGKDMNVIKFVSRGIEYIKFSSSTEEFKEKIQSRMHKNNRDLVADVVGTVAINEFAGRRTPQVVIEDFVVTGEGLGF